MTAFNLSASLNTDKVKTALEAMRADVKSKVGSIAIEADTTKIANEIDSALKGRSFQVQINTTALKNAIELAISKAFGVERTVRAKAEFSVSGLAAAEKEVKRYQDLIATTKQRQTELSQVRGTPEDTFKNLKASLADFEAKLKTAEAARDRFEQKAQIAVPTVTSKDLSKLVKVNLDEASVTAMYAELAQRFALAPPIAVKLQPGGAVNQIQDALSARELEVKLNGTLLRQAVAESLTGHELGLSYGELKGRIAQVLAHEYRLGIDEADLKGKLKRVANQTGVGVSASDAAAADLYYKQNELAKVTKALDAVKKQYAGEKEFGAPKDELQQLKETEKSLKATRDAIMASIKQGKQDLKEAVSTKAAPVQAKVEFSTEGIQAQLASVLSQEHQLNLSRTHIEQQLDGVLAREHSLNINRGHVEQQIDSILAREHNLNLNKPGITEQVREALAGITFSPVAKVAATGEPVAARPQPPTDAIGAAAIVAGLEALNTNIESMVAKMAFASAKPPQIPVAGDGDGGDEKKGSKRFAIGQSGRLASGETVRFSQGLKADEGQALLNSAIALAEGEKARKNLQAQQKAEDAALKNELTRIAKTTGDSIRLGGGSRDEQLSGKINALLTAIDKGTLSRGAASSLERSGLTPEQAVARQFGYLPGTDVRAMANRSYFQASEVENEKFQKEQDRAKKENQREAARNLASLQADSNKHFASMKAYHSYQASELDRQLSEAGNTAAKQAKLAGMNADGQWAARAKAQLDLIKSGALSDDAQRALGQRSAEDIVSRRMKVSSPEQLQLLVASSEAAAVKATQSATKVTDYLKKELGEIGNLAAERARLQGLNQNGQRAARAEAIIQAIETRNGLSEGARNAIGSRSTMDVANEQLRLPPGTDLRELIAQQNALRQATASANELLRQELSLVGKLAAEQAKISGESSGGQLAAARRAQMQAISAGTLSPTAMVAVGGRSAESVVAEQNGLPSTAPLNELIAGHQRLSDQAKASRMHMFSWRDAANEAHSAARGLAGALGTLWVTWGSTIPLVAAAALGGAIRSVYTIGKDVEYQLAFVSALSENAAISMDRFALSMNGLVPPKEAAEGMRALAQNGLNLNEQLSALPTVMSLATAGELKLADAALGATGVMAAFGLGVSELGRVSDVFAKAAAMSNTSVGGMVEAMKQASTVADQYNVSLEQTGAVLAVMAKRNIEGSAAGTAFRNMMVELTTPTRKASAAMKELGLNLYDNDGKLKDFDTVIKMLTDRFGTLNEQTKLEFSNAIFGERGGKAFNAILSDVDKFNSTLKELRENAKGFTDGVTEALKQTTQGKLKSLISEFQLVSMQAFQDASNGANLFIDKLRLMVNSPEFKQGLMDLVNGVTSLTSFLIENGKQVGFLLATYTGFKILTGVSTGLLGLAQGLRLVSTEATIMGVALRTALGPISLVLSVVGVLAGAYYLLSERTNESTKAEEARRAAVENGLRTGQQKIEQLDQENKLLARKIELQQKGLSGDALQKELDKEVGRKEQQSDNDRIEGLRRQLQREVQKRDQLNRGRLSGKNSNSEYFEQEDRVKLIEQDLQKAVEARDQNLALRERSTIKDAQTKQSSRLEQINELNKKFEELKARGRGAQLKDVQALGKDLADAEKVTDEQFKTRIEAQKAALNRAGERIALPVTGRGGAAQERRDTLAAFKYADQLRDLRAKNEQERFKNEQEHLKTLKRTGTLDQVGLYAAEEKALEGHYAKLIAIEDEGQTKRVKKLRDNLQLTSDKKKLADQDLVEFLMKAVKAGAENDKDPAEVIGEMLPRKTEEGVTTYTKLQPADILSILKDYEASGDKKSNLISGLRQKREDTQLILSDAKKDEDEKFREFLAKLQDDSQRSLFKDIASIGDYRDFKIGDKAGAGAMAEMFPQEYVASLDNRGLNAAAKEVRMQAREASRRRNFEASQQRKLQEGARTVSKPAQDEGLARAMEEYDRYTPAIQKADRTIESMSTELEKQQLLWDQLSKKADGAITTEMIGLEASILELERKIEKQREYKGLTEAAMASAVDARMRAATAEAEERRSIQFGMNRFWKGYTDAATDNARVIENVMGQTFNSMEAGLARFTQTGKGNFKDFTRSLLADAARIAQQAVIRKLLNIGVNMMLGGASTDATGGGFTAGMNSAVAGGWSYPTTMSANGNIMTSNGPLKLNMYANGGIANRPQLSIFGEGRTPEAYVPLPDGRTIPVTLSGEMGGGNTTQINSNVYVTIAADGKATVKSDNNSTQAEQLGKMMDTAVVQVLQREMRPGGILYR